MEKDRAAVRFGICRERKPGDVWARGWTRPFRPAGGRQLRGIVPPELALGWCASGREGRGFGGKAEGVEDRAHDRGIGDERDDAAATAARTAEDVIGEHAAHQVGPRQSAGSCRDFLAVLVAEEAAHREQTRIQRLSTRGGFPFLKTVDDFDFTYQSTVRPSRIARLTAPHG